MATYDASIQKAQATQADLINQSEHCSADPERLASIGRALGHQVRIRRSADKCALFTVSEVRQENPDEIVRVGRHGRERLGTTDVFDGVVDSQTTHPTFTDSEAASEGELVERLQDDGLHTGLIAIAPHGGAIEKCTDLQAERVASALAAKRVSSWLCKGWGQTAGAFDRWHITSTDINEASFPLLASVVSRGFRHAVAFHGFDDANVPYDVLIGGLAPKTLKIEIRNAIEAVVGAHCTVHITTAPERFGGDDPRNIVNRLTAGGANGVQIEQKTGARERYWPEIADAVGDVYASRLRTWWTWPWAWICALLRRVSDVVRRIRGILRGHGPTAGLVVLDRYLGVSTGWMRFVATAMTLSEMLGEFRLNWESERIAWSGRAPTDDELRRMLMAARKFLGQVNRVVRQETTAWIDKFQAVLSEFDKAGKNEKRDPGTHDQCPVKTAPLTSMTGAPSSATRETNTRS